MRKSFGAVVCGFAFLSLVIAGCAASTAEPEEGESVGTASEAISVGVVACVDQSSAAAFSIPGDAFSACLGANNTRLSRGHRVTVVGRCDSTHVIVRSHWNQGHSYRLRGDALSRC